MPSINIDSNCVKAVEEVIVDVEEVVQDIQLKTKEGYEEAVADAIRLVQDVKTSISLCLKKGHAMRISRLHSSHWTTDQIGNTDQYLGNIQAAVSDFNQGNWFDIGMQYGEMFNKANSHVLAAQETKVNAHKLAKIT